MTNYFDVWPGGATWVFQGTVAEDATGGTHVASLTVTPGAGNEIAIMYGEIKDGATATAQTPLIFIDDGTNELTRWFGDVSPTTSGAVYAFPYTGASGATTQTMNIGQFLLLSGTMRLKMQVTTTAVSVTQTFAVVARLKMASPPTATLLDTVGTSTNTTNTNAVF